MTSNTERIAGVTTVQQLFQYQRNTGLIFCPPLISSRLLNNLQETTCHDFLYFFNPTCTTSERSQSLRNETSTVTLTESFFPPNLSREVKIKQVSIPLRSV